MTLNKNPKDHQNQTDEMEFIEIDIEKQVENLKEDNNASNPLLFEKFKTKNDIAPLYVHEIFKPKLETKNPFLGGKAEKPKLHQKNSNNTPQGSIFLLEKLEKQIYEARQKKLELKMAKKNFSNSDRKPNDTFQKNVREGTDEVFNVKKIIIIFFFKKKDYELLKNDLKLLTGEYRELDDKYRDSQIENKHLREEIKKLSELNIFATSKIKKYELQKELLSKDISSSLENLSLVTKNYKKSKKTLADLVFFFFFFFCLNT